MILVITGLPGNGKTLFTISQVKEWAEREGRPVYYHGIPELTLDWMQLDDPTQWASVPPRSIVVIDEAQKTFRNRSLGSQPPKFVTDLETHRHLGIDLVLITQHPSLIDPAVRRLAGRHQHLVRIWGTESSTVHRWDSVKDNCDKSRADSEKTKWAFDKSVYSLYKSAEVHTMKRSIPKRVKTLVALGAVFVVLAGYFGHFMWKKFAGKAEVPETAVAVPAVPAASGVVGQAVGGAKGRDAVDPRVDAANYMWKETPRVAGMLHTAPKYDELTKPTRVPMPAGCLLVKLDCKCFTQQGTPYETTVQQCVAFVKHGYFEEFGPNGERKDGDRAVAQLQNPDVKAGVRGAAGGPSGGSVVVFDKVPSDIPKTPSAGSVVKGG